MCKDDCCHCCCKCDCDDSDKTIECKIRNALERGKESVFSVEAKIRRNMNCTYDGNQRWHIYIDVIYQKQIDEVLCATGFKHENTQASNLYDEGKIQVTFTN